MFQVPSRQARGKYADRPDPCRTCASAAWWNGTRSVSTTRMTDGRIERTPDLVRRRVRCSSSGCPARNWTAYEDGAHPHRSFQLDVAASAVAAVELGAQSLTQTAAEHQCSRDSVRRWIGWTEKLADPRSLERFVARLDPDGVPAPASPSLAASVLGVLERLADGLATRGVLIPRRGPGLQRILTDRLRRFGEVFYLTKFSPPLRADPLGLRV